MVRSGEDIEDLLEDLYEKIKEKVFLANRMDELDELLEKWGFPEYTIAQEKIEHYTSGKIVVIGASAISDEAMKSIIKENGISSDRLEYCGYRQAQKFNYGKLRYSSTYSVVLFGATPHSATGKGDANSIISHLEKSKGYPPIRRLTAGWELKITKSNFKSTIVSLLNERIISRDC